MTFERIGMTLKELITRNIVEQGEKTPKLVIH
jgi:hypothetical protein